MEGEENPLKRESYFKLYTNGKVHFNAAEILADQGNFGMAISHLILGMEELIKFIVVQACSGDEVRFSDKELHKVFTSHTDKHSLIIEFLQATRPGFEEDFVLSVFHKMQEIPLTAQLKIVDSNRFKELGSMLALERNLSCEEVDSFIEWLKKSADGHKNRGFYVDKKDRTKNIFETDLVSPAEVQRQEYEVCAKFAETFLKHAAFVKDIDITDEEFKDILNGDITDL